MYDNEDLGTQMLVLATVFPVGATEDDKRIFFVVSILPWS